MLGRKLNYFSYLPGVMLSIFILLQAANLRRWILAKAEYHSGCHDFSKSSKIWEGQDLKQALNNLGFGPGAVRQLTVCL